MSEKGEVELPEQIIVQRAGAAALVQVVAGVVVIAAGRTGRKVAWRCHICHPKPLSTGSSSGKLPASALISFSLLLSLSPALSLEFSAFPFPADSALPGLSPLPRFPA